MELGEKIRQIRVRKGFSQENVADMLCISTSAYGDIERNKAEVTVNRLLKIAAFFEIDVNDIIGDYAKNSATKEEITLLKAELLLTQIESARWKDRFMRSVFHDQERTRIGFK